MFNSLALCATLTSMPYVSLDQSSCVQQYTFPVTSDSCRDAIIDTAEASKQDTRGAYPWEIMKFYNNGLYFLYENYFRMGGLTTSKSRDYHYFQHLDHQKSDITRWLMNPVDYKKIRYFSIENILNTMSPRIEKAALRNYKYLPKLLHYRQVVLDLQKEVLDFKQLVWEMTYESAVNL